MIAEYRSPLTGRDQNLHAKRWYAQSLTDAIYRRRWIPLRFPVDGEPPNFRTVGANQLPPAQILHTTAAPIPRAGIPYASIKIGRQDYQRALARMTANQRTAWLWHVEPMRKDEHGQPLPLQAIFQADGAMVRDAPCHPDLRVAALIVIEHANVEHPKHWEVDE